jgi:Tol biopolymer transport system component
LFVTGPNEKEGKQIYAAAPGVHCHFPTWSPDAAFIYFVQGFPPNETDIWRIRPTGGTPERITFHNSFVAFPTFLDPRTLLYTTHAEDGSGPWLYAIDVERRVPHRISFGVERYTSIAATADRRRFVATVANPDASLWRIPISEGMVEESAASRVVLPTVRGLSPRFAKDYMLYLSSKGGDDGIWKLANGTAVELWSGSLGRVPAGPASSPDGQLIAFTPQKSGRTRLYVMNADGTGVREIGGSLDVRGSPAWSPDGKWITVGADTGSGLKLYNVPANGGPSIQILDKPAMDPVWSPDGSFLVHSGPRVGATIPAEAITPDGKPFNVPQQIQPRSNRFSFLPGKRVLVVLQGEFWHRNFWLIDLNSGKQRQLTNFSREFLISDFDVSPDGKEIIFGRAKENSNIILIDLPPS